MSLAEKLLDGMTAGGPAVYNTSTPEQHIIINADRTVFVPEDLKRIAVQFDHNIETVTFDCPRYWDGLDMSQMNVYINYIRSDNQTGAYTAEITSSDDTTMYFNWTIDRNVTEVKGEIAFLVCVKKVVDGEEVNHWNSELCRECYISEGLEAEEIISDQYPDIITQLTQKVDSLEGGGSGSVFVEILDGVLYVGQKSNTVSVEVNGNVLYLKLEG